MAFRVEILPVALLDAEDAYLWWRENVPRRADAWWNGLYEAIFSLEEFPYRCALAPESEELGMDVRQLLYGKGPSTYRIYFRIVGDDLVRVLHIHHGARDRLTLDEIMDED
jgi:plasmid stabilization system protein ParE